MTQPLDDLDFSHLFGPEPPPAPEADPFGRIGSGDPVWEAARGAWMEGAPLGTLFGDRVFDLNDTVGTGRANQRGDVFRLQALLHREGTLNAQATGGPTGYWGNRDDAALRDLQKQNGLRVDGWAAPDGETIGWLRDLYRPPQGVQVPEAEMEARRTTLAVGRDLAGQLDLDADAIDFNDPAVLPALGSVAFIRYAKGRERETALRKVQDLRVSDPKLAGRLQALAGEIVSQPQWHTDKLTPEDLQRARRLLDQGHEDFETWRRIVTPFLPGPVAKAVSAYYVRPMGNMVYRDETRRLDRELDRRRDPRDR